jgi:4-cresol dehydrogenase (hydroxylating)
MQTKDFAVAIDALRKAVGDQWVLTSEEDRGTYMDPYSIGDPHEHEPCGAVAPRSTDELQSVLKIANRYKIPLWPISMGKNLAYGGAAPRMKGTMVLDLSRMKRVLEINEELGYAVVEPGVNFFEFYKALEDRGGKLWMSGPAQSWGSVIGNALEHGVGYTPYGVHADMICGLEVMLANGEIVRTGLGAVEGSKEWHLYRHGFGPVWEGLFTQSNFAIVIKMGIWLMPEPEGMAGVRISVPREEDLEALVDTLRPLRLNDTINATYTIVNGVRQIQRGRTRDQLYQGKDHLPRDLIARELQKQGDGWWGANFLLFDRVSGLDIRLKAIEAAFAMIPGSKMTVERWKRGEPKQTWMRQDVGLGPLRTVDWYGGPGGHTDFGPVMAATGARVRQVYDIVYRRFVEHGIDCYVGMFGMDRRALVMVADIFYNKHDKEMTDRAQRLFRQLCKDVARIGVSLYRSHVTFMDDGADILAFNNHAFRRLNEQLKATLDPNGILAPGKQGIWSTTYQRK